MTVRPGKQERLFFVMPLKVLVWQGNDQQVWVSSPRIAYLTARYSIPET